jgi:DNA-binding LacI/PurR family transcriptional regulator/signal transduction histidine kinase
VDHALEGSSLMHDPQRTEQPALSPGACPTIGLLMDWIEQRYHAAIRSGIEAVVRGYGANLIYFAGGSLKSPQRFETQRNAMYDLTGAQNVDGLIIMAASIGQYISPAEFQQFCDRYRPLPMVSIALSLDGIASVLTDNTAGMRELLVHLIEVHGYRQIAFIKGREGNAEAEGRYRVYREMLSAYGLALDPRLVVSGDFSRPASHEAMLGLLKRREAAFEAVVAANDEMAIGALEALEACGVRVPDQIAVAGFDDIKDARLVTPSLTTVRQPLYEQGRCAAEMLLGLLRGEPGPGQVVLPTRLQVRRSCGCLDQALQPAAPEIAAPGSRARVEKPARERGPVESLGAPVASEGGAQLLESFVAALIDQRPDVFLKTLNEILRQAPAEGDQVAAWQRTLMTLNQQVLPYLHDKELLLRAARLWQQAQELIREAQQAHVYWNLQSERQTPLLLHQVGQVLITTFDMEQLMEAVSQQLVSLGINRCYLAMYEGAAPAEWSRLLLAFEAGRRQPLAAGGLRFRSRDLLPRQRWPVAAPYTLIAEALYFGEEQFGFALFGDGPTEGIIYEVLAVQISNALKGALLVQQVQNHAATLETEVATRTLEMTRANEQLQREIVERKRAEEQLAEAHSRLAEVREAEQLRMAQDLHDGAVQQLIGISYAVEELRRRVSQHEPLEAQFSNELSAALQDTRWQVLDVSRQLRSLISELRPLGLKELGLRHALEGYVAHLQREVSSGGPEIRLSLSPGLPPLPEVAAICLFRVAQEALRNALQHAGARQIDVSLLCDSGDVILRVWDDGAGFQVPAHFGELTRHDHFGLAGMSERVAWSSGRLAIRSRPGAGTEITATVPFARS